LLPEACQLRSNHQWVNESNGSALGHQRPRRYLEEGDWAVVTSKKVVIFDRANQPIERQVRETALSGALIGKGNYRHFMQKEIFEQPAVSNRSVRRPCSWKATMACS
jgi:glucosamine 6-phosphate synthetase-like amidotransferase/phosphosugar isomerase protein